MATEFDSARQRLPLATREADAIAAVRATVDHCGDWIDSLDAPSSRSGVA